MPRQITFIHAADLHIGAPFRGLRRAASSTWADRLIEAIPQAYERIIDEACSRKVDFVIIAGDMFDDAHASYADYRRFYAGLERLSEAGIPVYMCTGNHDPYAVWQKNFIEFPQDVHMFSADHCDFALYERDGEPLCVLGSRGYLNSVWPQDRSISEGITRAHAHEVLGERAAEAPFGVGVLHTGLDIDALKAPAKQSDLLQAGFDYWALGHIHRRFVDNEDDPHISFSGCIQGRDIKETGRRGVNLVTLTEGEKNKIEFIPTASITWQQLEVDVSACESISDVVKAIKRSQFEANAHDQCENMVLRITLVGTTALHSSLANPQILEDIRDEINESYAEFFTDTLIDRTKAPFDRKALSKEGLFPAVLLQEADNVRLDESSAKDYISKAMLEKGVLPSDDTYLLPFDNLIDDAENLVLDALMQEDSL